MFKLSGKLSGLRFAIYTNEVPRLADLMTNETQSRKTFNENVTEYTNVQHKSMNFVNDMNSIFTFEDPEKINFNIDRYFKIQKFYYNEMKLQLNPEKIKYQLCQEIIKNKKGKM